MLPEIVMLLNIPDEREQPLKVASVIHIVNSSVLSAFSICLLSCRPIFQREPTIVLCWWIYSFNHSRIECWWDRWPTGASTFVVVAYSSHKVAVEGRRGLEASSSTPWAKIVQQQAAWRAIVTPVDGQTNWSTAASRQQYFRDQLSSPDNVKDRWRIAKQLLHSTETIHSRTHDKLCKLCSDFSDFFHW